jgi:stage II sporulation protein AA (anti-sigma F factor antagonist)
MYFRAAFLKCACEKRRKESNMDELLEVKGNILIIYVPEELDHHCAEKIRIESDRILTKQNIRQIVFDFRRTVFMDSSGIGVIMGRYRNINLLGGRVKAIHVGEQVEKILRISGIYKVIAIETEHK